MPSKSINWSAQIAHWVAAASFVTGAGTARATPQAPTGESAGRLELPALTVSTQVPLQKTGEFPMKRARFAPAAVAQGPYIYIIGGQDGDGTVLTSVERFNTEKGISTEFAELQVGRMWHRAVLVGDQIYILGGYTSTPRFSASQSRTRPSENGPENLVARADARMEAALSDVSSAAAMGLKLVDTVEAIDLGTGKVRTVDTMPDPRAEFGCLAIGNRIYVVGGKHLYKDKLAITSRVDEWDATTRRWHEGTHLPYATTADATLVDGPFIVVAGGYNGQRSFDRVVALDPRTDAWKELPPLSRTSSAHAGVFLDRFLVLFGSYDAPGEIITYDLQAKTAAVFTLQYKPARHAAAVRVDDQAFVIGGKPYTDSEPSASIQRFELTKNLPPKSGRLSVALPEPSKTPPEQATSR